MRFAAVLCSVGCALALGVAQAAEECGSLANGYGPYDYRTDKSKLGVVETNHFTREVELLIRGKSAALGGDIDYTLRAFPNHHRALRSMERLGARLKTNRPHQATYTVSCYFERAIQFRPNDATVRMLYANYLVKQGHAEAALQHMKAAEEAIGDNANLHYNMGLAYLDLKDYDNALKHAHRAYQLGFPLPGLRNRLERAGKWRDVPKIEPTAAQTSTPGAAKPDAQTEAKGDVAKSEGRAETAAPAPTTEKP